MRARTKWVLWGLVGLVGLVGVLNAVGPPAPAAPAATPVAQQPESLDEGARAACDSLLFDINDAGGARALVGVDAERWGVMVRQYRHQMDETGNELVRDSAAVLTNVTTGSVSARLLALDTAAGRCLDAGWDPN